MHAVRSGAISRAEYKVGCITEADRVGKITCTVDLAIGDLLIAHSPAVAPLPSWHVPAEFTSDTG